MLNTEEWEIAVEIYKKHPTAALNLAFQLIAIKQSLERENKGIAEAIEGLELGIASLYPHTVFTTGPKIIWTQIRRRAHYQRGGIDRQVRSETMTHQRKRTSERFVGGEPYRVNTQIQLDALGVKL